MDKQELIESYESYKKLNIVGIMTNKGTFCLDCHVYERDKLQH